MEGYTPEIYNSRRRRYHFPSENPEVFLNRISDLYRRRIRQILQLQHIHLLCFLSGHLGHLVLAGFLLYIPIMASIKPIFSVSDAERILDLSAKKTVVIYKHSPICSISEMAIEEFEAFAKKSPEGAELFSVDVISARPASLKIEELTGIRHESPQVLILADGKVAYHASHRRIRAGELETQVAALP